ncbi:MAG: hypothetical protein HOG72_03345 [Campylobacteraceae bacterium]|nr:hypothetical protein [Campylobacteraceae bacterium]
MSVLNILKSKINSMNKELLRLHDENQSLRLELDNINSENNHLLQRSEDMLSTIDKTLSNPKYAKENDIDILDIIESEND